MGDKHRNIVLQNIEFYLAKFLAGTIRIFPTKLAFFMAKVLGIVAYYIDFVDRKLMKQHLLHVGVVKTKKEATKIARKNYIHMVKLGVEFIKFDQYFKTKEDLLKRVTVVNTQEIRDAIKNEKVLVFVGMHFGNWEITGLYGSAIFKPMLSVMSTIGNEKITNFILEKRKQFNQTLCFKKNSFKELVNALKTGRSVGIISDEHAGSKGVEATFFGHPALTHISAALLSIRSGAPIIVGSAMRTSDNFTYTLFMEGPFWPKDFVCENSDETVQKLTQAYTNSIENIIKKDLTQWTWCHKRWTDINRKRSKGRR